MCGRVRWLIGLAILCVGGWGLSRWRTPPPPDVAVVLRRAILAAKTGKTDRATQLFDAVLTRQPDHPQALLYRGQLARDAGHLEQALEYWRRIPDKPQQQAGVARYLEGTILLERGRAREAERAFLRSIQLHPTYVQPHSRLSELYAFQLRGAEARSELEQIRRIRPWTAKELSFYTSATDLKTLVDPKEMIPAIRQYVAADPDDLPSLRALATYRALQGRNRDAVALLRRARKRHPDDRLLLAALAEILVDWKQLGAAADILGDRLTAAKPEACFWRSLGLYALAKKNWKRAVFWLSQAVRREPLDLGLSYKFGMALARSGRMAESKQQLERSRLTDKMLLDAYRIQRGDKTKTRQLSQVAERVAGMLTSLDRPAEAAGWYRQVLLWNPRDRRLQARLRPLLRQAQAAATRQKTSVTAVGAADQVTPPAISSATGSDPKLQTGASSTIPPDSGRHTIRFVDRQAEAGVDFRYFNGANRFHYILESMGGGVAVLDYDNDGWPDLFFAQGCEIPFKASDHAHTNRLFRNRGDGTFEDVTAAAGLVDNHYGQGCTAGDYDNDGDPDLVVANWGRNLFYRNNGDGTFQEISASAGLKGDVWSSSLALADLDSDGDLDLYVANYVQQPLKTCARNGRTLTCSPINFSAEQDRLYQNRGDGTFTDVSVPAGIVAADGKGLGVVVADFDDDGRPDIYVANDTTPNFLYRNVSGDGILRFQEQGLVSGTAVNENGVAHAAMGIACTDFNGDGRLDLAVTNFYQEGVSLYLNEGELQFSETGRAAGLWEPTRLMLGFGAQPLDADLDGRMDLLVTNGHIHDARFRGEPWKMQPKLFRNRGGAVFQDVSASGGEFFQGKYLGRGMARLDWNRDGRPDAVIVHHDRPVALLQNTTTPVGHYLVVELHGVRSNRDAIGAQIRVTSGAVQQTRVLQAGCGYYADNERRLTIGLGTATRIDAIEIRWPDGEQDRWTDLPADALLTLVEGRSPQFTRSDHWR